MNDAEYQEKKQRLTDAHTTVAELQEPVLAEAVRRGEAYVLRAHYYHSLVEWPFFSLAEAVDRAQDDCYPHVIVGPDSTTYDPYTGERGPGDGR